MKFIFSVFLVLPCFGAISAPFNVTTMTMNGTVANTLTWTTPTIAGDLLHIIAFLDNTVDVVTSFTGNTGATWTKESCSIDPTFGGTTCNFWLSNAPSETTVTIVCSATCGVGVVASEYSGVALTSSKDGFNSNIAAANTSIDGETSNTVTTTTNGDLIVGGCQTFTTAPNVGTGFTSIATSPFSPGRVEYLIQFSAGAIAATFTGVNSTLNYSCTVLAFKPASGAVVISRHHGNTFQ